MLGRLRDGLRRLLPAPVRRLLNGFWAVPLALSVAGLLVALGLNYVPRAWVDPLPSSLLDHVDEVGARDVLSVIAGAVMTVVSIVLSLTFVALTLISQQLSPRMLDFVLRERVVQLLLGLGLATFLFATISLTYGTRDVAWRLGLASGIGLCLATATLGAVMLFAHRLTEVMRPDEMIARRGDAFVRALRREMELADDHEPATATLDDEPLEAPFAGYVGVVDVPAVLHLARDHEVDLIIHVREGDFVLAGDRIGGFRRPHGDVDQGRLALALARLLNMSNRREATGGAMYEAHALAEGAIRALSPGINDPGTAMACLNRLIDGLDFLACRADPGGLRRCTAASGSVVWAPTDVRALTRKVLDPLSHHAVRDPQVTEHLRDMLQRLQRKCRAPVDKAEVTALLERTGRAVGEPS